MNRKRRKRRRYLNYLIRMLSILLCVIAVITLGSFTLDASEEEIVTEIAVLGVDEPDNDISPERVSTVINKPLFLQEEKTVAKTIPESRQWTDAEATALAKMLWGEARGVESDTEKAACVWCVLNRCDIYNESIISVVTAPNQFVGYNAENPVDDALYALCEDVLARYFAEKSGEENVGRVLPADYLYFTGDGQHNHFRNEFIGGTIWDWSLKSPYEN